MIPIVSGTPPAEAEVGAEGKGLDKARPANRVPKKKTVGKKGTQNAEEFEARERQRERDAITELKEIHQAELVLVQEIEEAVKAFVFIKSRIVAGCRYVGSPTTTRMDECEAPPTLSQLLETMDPGKGAVGFQYFKKHIEAIGIWEVMTLAELCRRLMARTKIEIVCNEWVLYVGSFPVQKMLEGALGQVRELDRQGRKEKGEEVAAKLYHCLIGMREDAKKQWPKITDAIARADRVTTPLDEILQKALSKGNFREQALSAKLELLEPAQDLAIKLAAAEFVTLFKNMKTITKALEKHFNLKAMSTADDVVSTNSAEIMATIDAIRFNQVLPSTGQSATNC